MQPMPVEPAPTGMAPSTRDALLLEHLRLVKHVVSQIMRTTSVDAEFDDLVSAGTIGLMNAIDNFDPSRGLAFSTFAAPRIRGSILDDLRRRDHVPRSVRKKQRDLNRAYEALSHQLGRAPSDEEVAVKLDIEIDRLHSWRQAAERADQISLDGPVETDDGKGTTGEAFIAAEEERSIEDRISVTEEMDILREKILELKEQERLVLALYYFEELKLHEIADMMGVTESRVSQIRSKAIKTLRGRMGHLRSA